MVGGPPKSGDPAQCRIRRQSAIHAQSVIRRARSKAEKQPKFLPPRPPPGDSASSCPLHPM
eukprot:10101146-Alexandrium_andersonii.AAC.1